MQAENKKRPGAPKKAKTKSIAIRYNAERWDEIAKQYKGSINKMVGEFLDSLPLIKNQ